MFHRKVKTDLPSIPLSLLDTSSSITAGTRTVKQAEYKNQTRSEPCKLGENQLIMFQKNPQSEPIKWSSGKITSIDGERSYTIRDTKTGAEYSRNRLHIKPKPSVPATPICPDPQANTDVSSRRPNDIQLPSTETKINAPSVEKAVTLKPKTTPETVLKDGGRPKRITRPPDKLKDFVTQ